MIEIIDDVAVKYCPRCEETLPVEMFAKNQCKPDGLQGMCKSCHSEYHKQPDRRGYAREYLKTEKSQEYWKNLRQTEEYKEKHRIAMQRARQNPEEYWKHIVRHRLIRAVRNGKIIKPEACTLCGFIGKIEGHHFSYEPGQELNVLWVCHPCHAKIHYSIDFNQEESE